MQFENNKSDYDEIRWKWLLTHPSVMKMAYSIVLKMTSLFLSDEKYISKSQYDENDITQCASVMKITSPSW